MIAEPGAKTGVTKLRVIRDAGHSHRSLLGNGRRGGVEKGQRHLAPSCTVSTVARAVTPGPATRPARPRA